MKRFLSLAAVGFIAVPLAGTPAVAQSAAAPPAPHTVDLKKYVEEAAAADLFEVKASQLALQRSQDPAIRQFAQKMVSENTDAANKLKVELDKAKIGVSPPTALEPERQALLDKLMNVGMEDFNKLYMTMQVAGQQESVTLHTAFGNTGQDNFRAYARAMITQAKDHLAQAQRIDAQLPAAK